MSKNILITGGAGFIGSHLIKLFVNKYDNYNIFNLDLLTYAETENLKSIENKHNYNFIKGDINDFKLVKILFKVKVYLILLIQLLNLMQIDQ